MSGLLETFDRAVAMVDQFPWLRPPVIVMPPEVLAQYRAQEGCTGLLVEALGPNCETCRDTGEVIVEAGSCGIPIPCPECPASDDLAYDHGAW